MYNRCHCRRHYSYIIAIVYYFIEYAYVNKIVLILVLIIDTYWRLG